MNKKELQTNIDEMRVQLAEMEKKLKEPENKLWVPTKGEEHYQISDRAHIDCYSFGKMVFNLNCFETREQAERQAKRETAFREISRVCELVNGGEFNPEVGDDRYITYYEQMDCNINILHYRTSVMAPFQFKSKEAAEKALEMISEESKKLLKGKI